MLDAQRLGGGPDRVRKWVGHAGHGTVLAAGPHAARRAGMKPDPAATFQGSPAVSASAGTRLITLDGSEGEGGGQILRTALTLSLLTGRPFRLVKVRANRDKPGLRPQHLTAVEAAAALGNAEVVGGHVGSRDVTFRPRAYTPRDLDLDIGTAGATGLVLQTLHLPIALRAEGPILVTLSGGTFNTRAPSFPFLDTTWRAHLAALGASVNLSMPTAGFYPRGGGRLDAWIEPARLQPLILKERGRLVRLSGVAGVSQFRPEIAVRLEKQVGRRLAEVTEMEATPVEIALVEWRGPSPGAALALTAEYDGAPPVTFVALGERGKPAETVADEAVDEWFAHHDAPGPGAIDPHSADQILLPLALTPGRSEFTVSAVTDHLRTNARTVRAFLDRRITVAEPEDGSAGRVVVE